MDWSWIIVDLNTQKIVDSGIVLKGTIDVDYISSRFSTFTIKPTTLNVNQPLNNVQIIVIKENKKTIFKGRIREFIIKENDFTIQIKAHSLLSFFDNYLNLYHGEKYNLDFWLEKKWEDDTIVINEDYVRANLGYYYGYSYSYEPKTYISFETNQQSLINLRIKYKENIKLKNNLLWAMLKTDIVLQHKLENKTLIFNMVKQEPIKVFSTYFNDFELYETNENYNAINQLLIKVFFKVWKEDDVNDKNVTMDGYYRCILLKDGSIVKDILQVPEYPSYYKNNYLIPKTTNNLAQIDKKLLIFPTIKKHLSIFKMTSNYKTLKSDTVRTIAYDKAESIFAKTTDSLFIKFSILKDKAITKDLYENIKFGNAIGTPILIKHNKTTFKSSITGFKYSLGDKKINIKIGSQRVNLIDKINNIEKGAI